MEGPPVGDHVLLVWKYNYASSRHVATPGGNMPALQAAKNSPLNVTDLWQNRHCGYLRFGRRTITDPRIFMPWTRQPDLAHVLFYLLINRANLWTLP
ncbi:protein of unknown function [Azospirillum lipoferum 4B]|uniref:Uncharacterized protein n=1 Tax=Azospirillum lipoferum (strain 4B) TaxID=862719 RepID=G7Z8X1_AZOL4|nr:protein of unknown function [Azospirillum lipoferum 4B]